MFMGRGLFKCHSKICLITYQERNTISHHANRHRNYNEKTAGLYIDFVDE